MIFDLIYSENKKVFLQEMATIKSMADSGNPVAMAIFGEELEHGDRIKSDLSEAIKYYKSSAELGLKEGPILYFSAFSKKLYGEEQFQKDLSFFEEMALSDGAFAYRLALALYEGDNVEENFDEANKYMQIAAEDGVEEAYLYLKIPPKTDNPSVIVEYASHLEDKKEYFKYIKMAAEGGDWKGAEKLREALSTKICGEENIFTEITEFKNMADQGNVEVALQYGVALENGDFGEKNVPEAMKYYKFVARRSHWNGTEKYFHLIQNFKEEIQDFKKMAERGNKHAALKYSDALRKGLFGETNAKEAEKFFQFSLEDDYYDSSNF